ELVRMIKTIAGEDGFRKGVDLYFDRHDGQAATIEDFMSSLEDGAGIDLAQFKLWYEQAGTPQIVVAQDYDEAGKTLRLDVHQKTPATPGQETKKALHIPVKFGLVGKNGDDLAFDTVTGADVTGDVIHLKNIHHQIVFKGVPERPVPSLLREFSAPVRLEQPLSEDDLIHLIGNDSDSFNRWQAMQTIALRVVLDKIHSVTEDRPVKEGFDCFFDGVEATIGNEDLDPAFRSQFLGFASETDIAQALGSNVNPAIIHDASQWLKAELARRAEQTLITIYEKNQVREAYSPKGEQVAKRQLKNAALSVLATGTASGLAFARQQYDEATNLTDRFAALSALVLNRDKYAEAALRDFDKRYRSKPLVMDKWFAVQAMSPFDGTLATVKELMKHPVFSITNPNRIRSLIGAFAASNQSQFHRADGAGYQFLSNIVVDLDATNPQVAARLLTCFSAWRLLEPRRRDRAERALKRIANSAGLSADVRDIVNRTLG
ncbi:MAG: DUF3458 domain-containing protein, partial [Pseudomonadota bacterium]